MMADNAASPLDGLRARIDDLDARLVELLNERARVVVEIGRLKQQTSAPIYAPDREKRVMARVRELNNGPLPDRCLEAVWRELMSGSFALEKPLRIAYAGPAGNFSHAAAVRKFGSSVEYVPLADVSTVFSEISRGHADYGLVPMEDSLHGGLAETLDAFFTASTRIVAEVLIRLRLHLLSGSSWEEVSTVLASPETLARCRRTSRSFRPPTPRSRCSARSSSRSRPSSLRAPPPTRPACGCCSRGSRTTPTSSAGSS
ncbi:MAG TPA: chorismate mutase [Tepidisphaeraceae bacterium]|nr:chorismate mutase [Tepidisphaeraceae bacterium]